MPESEGYVHFEWGGILKNVTKHTEVTDETENNQGLQIYALQGSPGNRYFFVILKSDER